MKRLWILIFPFYLLAQTLQPSLEIRVKNSAQDVVHDQNQLIIATSGSEVLLYDLKVDKAIQTIQIPQVKDFTGELIDTKIFSIDKMGDKILFVSDSGEGGYSDMWLYENNQTKKVLSAKDKLSIIKAKFIDPSHTLLGLLGNEAVLYDLNAHKIRYRKQLEPSKFSDFALSCDHSRAVFGCESGVLDVIDTKTGKILKKLKGINRDNVYKVALSHDIVAAAGKDKRGALYDLKSGKGDFIPSHFFIYSTALSPSGKQVAFTMNEENDIVIYDTQSKEKLATLKGQKSRLNTILFLDEDRVVGTSDDDRVMVWNLKPKEQK